MSTQTIIVAGWCSMNAKARDEALAGFSKLAQRARSAPGCIDFAISADPLDPGRVNLFEHWQSEETLSAWRAAAKRPKGAPRLLRVEMQKHVVAHSGPPFGKARKPARAR